MTGYNPLDATNNATVTGELYPSNSTEHLGAHSYTRGTEIQKNNQERPVTLRESLSREEIQIQMLPIPIR